MNYIQVNYLTEAEKKKLTKTKYKKEREMIKVHELSLK